MAALRRVSITLATLFTIASGAGMAMDTQSDELDVLAAEDAYVAAEVSRDEATLREIVADDFQLNSSSGKTFGKEALIRDVLSWNMSSQNIRERTVMVQGDSAVIFGTAELVFDAGTPEVSTSLMRYTSTYLRRQGKWQFWALHMSERKTVD
jgi:hypothetical protein